MGRSGRLAIGVVAAAMAAGHLAPNQLGAAAALTTAGLLVAAGSGRHRSVRTLWPLLIGVGLIAIRLSLTPSPPTGLAGPPAGDGPWTLIVAAVGSPRDGQQTATLATSPASVPGWAVAATLPRYPALVPGDRVVVAGAIRPPPESPFGAYLERIGAVGTLSSRTLTVTPAPMTPGRWLELVRRTAADGLARVLPEPEAGLAAGILIGLRDLVDRDLAAAFTAAGVSHVVAISGWNIAIVAAAVAALTGRLGQRRRSVATFVAIIAYVGFAGASPSVVRAAVMAAVVLLARETGRAGRAVTALGWAVVLILVADPSLVADPGFQLSSLATAGLLAWATPLTDHLSRVGGGRCPRWLAESLGVSLAAQAATLPVVLASFGRLAVVAPVVNLVVVPLVAPAMAAGLVAMLGGLLVLAGGPALVGAVAAMPGWVILRTLVAVVDAGAALPFASVTLGAPFDTVAALVMALAVVAVTSRGRWSGWRSVARRGRQASRRATDEPGPGGPGRIPDGPTEPRGSASVSARPTGSRATRAALAALVVSLAIAGAVVAARPAGVPTVSVLDVGQGDAILVEGSRGGRLLVDGGPDPDRLLVALDARVPPWDRRIDVLVLSHPHEDHVAGLALLLARYRVGRVFEPGMLGPGPGYAAWDRALDTAGAPPRALLAAGDHLSVDEISLEILWPVRGSVPREPPDGGTGINNVSVVMLGSVARSRFLLMGDVEEAIDPSLLGHGLPRVDFLKVAHHGSRTATTEPFVEAVRPRVAVASAGAGNPYGHPAPATLERLADAGARVFRTDRDGTVVATFGPDGMAAHAEGGRSAVADPVPTSPGQAGGRPIARLARSSTHAAARFLCAIPVTGLLVDGPSGRPDGDAVARTTRAAVTGPAGPAHPDVHGGRGRVVGYHRPDDRARPGGSGAPAALPRPLAPIRAARPGRRRGRGLAGHPDRPERRRRGSPARGSRGPPP